jgi:hypothetical protein
MGSNRNSLRTGLILLMCGLLTSPKAAFAQDRNSDARRLVTPATKRSIDAGLSFLAARQETDGSFGSGDLYRRSIGVTALSGMAFLAGGHTPGDGPYGQAVDRAISFLVKRCNANGFIVEPGSRVHGPMYGHGFAVTFLAEVYGMAEREDLRPVLERSVKLILSSQNKEGGWRYEPKPTQADVSVTVCQVMALRSARNAGIYVPKETIDRAVQYLRDSQNSDGGFRYQKGRQPESAFARSAACLVGLNSAGIYEGDEIERGLDYLMRFRPSDKGPRPFQIDHYFYGHYYAVQTMWHSNEDDWPLWYGSVRDEIVKMQHQNGGWREQAVCPEYATAMACLVLEMPYNFLPIFQR